ncbi:hypothetical protein Pmani_027843 [Petrolisthes manimaculis]|uniref:Uridine diphosphate glucose pyrophosphatase NUDT14 n=1 Tax=Petrolisthes manimaculis TaxID=1843537 RepID=A0AAE1P397_9EUCA|nr:hypothetical protein Pmani_027843 [Petrolisthes manimaculis]
MYPQNNEAKTWELVTLHESVAIIIYNKQRQKLVLVKQFRPAVYFSGLPSSCRKTGEQVDTTKYPGSSGVTLELCAGIVDQDKPLVNIAQQEVLEECGYQVPLEALQKIKTFRAGVGVSGDRQNLFYVEVDDKMKVTQGGGLAEEGEMIDVVEISVDEVRAMVNGPEEVTSPAGLLFGLSWFLQHKAPPAPTP